MTCNGTSSLEGNQCPTWRNLVGGVGAHIGLALAATDGFFASIGAAMTGFSWAPSWFNY